MFDFLKDSFVGIFLIVCLKSKQAIVWTHKGKTPYEALNAKSGDIDHLNPVESDHLLSGAN